MISSCFKFHGYAFWASCNKCFKHGQNSKGRIVELCLTKPMLKLKQYLANQ